MIKWDVAEFKLEKTNDTISFESKVLILEDLYRFITFTYDGQKVMVDGSELELGFSLYEIERRLESLLETNLIKILIRPSRNKEYLRSFVLFNSGLQTYNKMTTLHYFHNDKFLTIGNVLVQPPHSIREVLCKVPLEVETNAVSDIKSFHELLTEICRSAVRINVDLNNVNEIIEILLQKIEV